MATTPRNQYRLEVVTNRLGIVHLRLKPPRGGEIILSGELLGDHDSATRTAERIAEGAKRGFKVVQIHEGPKS